MRDEEWGATVWRAVGSFQLKGEFATRSQSENSPGHFQLLGRRYLILGGQGSLGRGQGGALCKALLETGPQDGRVGKGWHAQLGFLRPAGVLAGALEWKDEECRGLTGGEGWTPAPFGSWPG